MSMAAEYKLLVVTGNVKPNVQESGAWSHLDRQPRGLPLRKSVLQAPDIEAPRAQLGHRLERQDAVRAAAIGDDLLLARQLGKPLLQLAQRDVQCAWQMAEAVFIFGPDVEQHDTAVAQSRHELGGRDRLQLIARSEIGR